MSTLPTEDQFDTALLLTLRDGLQNIKAQTEDIKAQTEEVKAQTAHYEDRLAELEDTVKELAKDIKKLVILRTVEAKDKKPDEEVKKQAPDSDKSDDKDKKIDAEEMGSHWNYIVAQKGGYNSILRVTIRELFNLGEDSIQFLAFLAQKRETEIRQQLEQLQAEYKKLQGSQLQEHFGELWKSHYSLLKKKRARTWKEEIFLDAFDAFILWLQH
jgi:chromosome segregation ATPase